MLQCMCEVVATSLRKSFRKTYTCFSDEHLGTLSMAMVHDRLSNPGHTSKIILRAMTSDMAVTQAYYAHGQIGSTNKQSPHLSLRNASTICHANRMSSPTPTQRFLESTLNQTGNAQCSRDVCFRRYLQEPNISRRERFTCTDP